MDSTYYDLGLIDLSSTFQNMRQLLSIKASKGLLTVRQTIDIKKVIHDLNRGVVGQVASLLNITNDSMPPHMLLQVVSSIRKNGTLDENIERQIKHVIYVRKMEGIKKLINILNMSIDDKELPIPTSTPKDLLNALFSSSIDLKDVKG